MCIVIGTGIDFLVHHMSPRFSVPLWYFPHKIFWGTLWASVGYFLYRRYAKTWLELAVVVFFIPALVLQIMYFVKAHLAVDVVILFFILHFFMFLAPALVLFKKYKNLLLPARYARDSFPNQSI